jgi:tetratricopeptide (TPR) repeat protein
MSRVGEVKGAETLLKEALDWADEKEDKSLRAFLRLSGSRLDSRRQDLYRARERAQEALELYRELDSVTQQAEVLGQLALIEFNDGKPNAALDRVNQADELSEVAPLRALTNFIRGLVAQRDKQLDKAIEFFEQANQLAGQAGRGALALDAGMKMGEALLASKQTAKAADVLNRVSQIAQGIRAPAQERTACAMLAQAHASQQNYEADLGVAQRALKISTSLKFQKLIPADLYNVGLFQLMLKKPSEAVAILKQSRELADATNVPFMKELLFHLAQAQLQIGERSAAEQTLAEAMKPIQATQDGGRALIVYQQLGELAKARNDLSRAKEMFNQALNIAKQVKNKEAQKALKERIKGLK